jgi:uncharacterized membrane protein
MKSPWLLRLLALAGLAISVYLLTLKLTGRIDGLAGCGAGSGCDNVLGSRWSQFFHIPVTGLAAGMYAGLLLATWRPTRPVYAGLAICFAGAALWFYSILIFALKAFCPWCATAHLIGLTCAVLLTLTLRKQKSIGGKIHLGIIGGIVAMLIFVFGQVYGPIPDTHAISTESVAQEDRDASVHARGEGRVVSLLDDKKFYNTSTLPHLGSSDAPHVIVEYFDWTCEACSEMHEDLKMVAGKHPGKFCMILLPVPLNRACNEFFPPGIEDHEGTCELARLGLAAWRAMPEAFPEVHDVLFTRPVLPPEIAEIAVAQIVGEEALAAALKDPWIEEILTANTNDFRQMSSKTVKMPKLVVSRNKCSTGSPRPPRRCSKRWNKNSSSPPPHRRTFVAVASRREAEERPSRSSSSQCGKRGLPPQRTQSQCSLIEIM